MCCLLMSTKMPTGVPLLAAQCVNFELILSLFRCLKSVCKSPRNLSPKTGDMVLVTCLALLLMLASVSILTACFTDVFWRSFELGGGLFQVFSSFVI